MNSLLILFKEYFGACRVENDPVNYPISTIYHMAWVESFSKEMSVDKTHYFK